MSTPINDDDVADDGLMNVDKYVMRNKPWIFVSTLFIFTFSIENIT